MASSLLRCRLIPGIAEPFPIEATAMSTARDQFDERVMIPDLLKAAPQPRAVLDRYGLRGCGGPPGPVETLACFAQGQHLPVAPVLVELRRACNEQSSIPEQAALSQEPADVIYRPFFKAGIAIVLSLGAVWGAYLLLRIAIAGKFDEVGLHEVNAHGHAQIFGW